MRPFLAKIALIGIDPYVLLPEKVLSRLFRDAGRDRGSIPVEGEIDGHAYTKYLVKYRGQWRLYLNGVTRKAAGKEVGDTVRVSIAFDPASRTTAMPAKLLKALRENRKAENIYRSLTPSLQKEISRYIGNLKSAEARDRNVTRAIRFLLGKERFIGRPPLARGLPAGTGLR